MPYLGLEAHLRRLLRLLSQLGRGLGSVQRASPTEVFNNINSTRKRCLSTRLYEIGGGRFD